jgi:predicted transposase YbfD/YdcC
MQYTLPAPSTAMARESTSPQPLVVFPSTLLAAFATIPDPRRRQGTRFTLAAILALAVAAILSNHLSVLAIAEWGADQSRDLLHQLGFPHGTTPHQSTLQRLFRKLDPSHLTTALCHHLTRSDGTQARPRGSQGVAIDGKAQRGRLAFDHTGCPVHALSAFCHEHGIILAQVPIEAGADKVEAELTVAPALIERIDWQGRVFTGDALFCQRKLCRQIIEAGGDYLLLVKENQPTLCEDIRLLFDPPFLSPPLSDRREARTVDHGHGRHYDTRHLVASTDLVGYSDWPALAQVFRLERTWQEKGENHRVIQYGITSLPPQIADAARLLELKRGHWQIENGLHHVKDVTLGEDKSLIHTGSGPSVMAMLRDLTVSLLRRAGYRTIAARLRYHSRHPEASIALLTHYPIENA